MIRLDCQQGSPSWRQARVGVVTASEIDNVLTPGKLVPAKGTAYLHRLVAETMLGQPIDTEGSPWMERGTQLEPEARAWYEFDRGVTVEPVGFLLRDDRRLGASPDGLVGDDGVAEFKNPSAVVHTGYLLDPASLVAEYRGQAQVEILVSERKWCDLVSFNPVLPPVVVRVTPDAAYLAALAPALDAFLARLDAALAKVRPHMEARAANPFL